MPEEIAEFSVSSPEPQLEPFSFFDKLKIHKLKILGGILLGLGFAGAVFGAYSLGQRQAQPAPIGGPTPTISPGQMPDMKTQRVAGVDLSIDKALRVKRVADKDLLVITATFAANVECPLSGGAACGYDIRGFRLLDEEGLVQEMLFSYPEVEFLITNPISQRILKLGEKDRGDIFFEIPKDKNKFYLTYSSAGETTGQILVEPELLDPECTKSETGEMMTLSEARGIAQESVCVEEGDHLTKTYSCNESTGTWWLGLDIEKEGCAPSCVVDVSTGEVEINWRCTGFGPQE